MNELVFSTVGITLGAVAAEIVRAWLKRRSEVRGMQLQIRTADGKVVRLHVRDTEDLAAAVSKAIPRNDRTSPVNG
jgi:hypothetical protein